ncbi:hypothetical protein OFR22_04760 [Brachyspira hyodysenteriae]|uniref:DUF4878 domain-containing protein n=1 Tax=Brachyspira hyodysenteriae ATCC 27164 TaxID=1266923 RepID=A0A3B6VXE7_BRAHO|nr:hypothetical protein [Brachyspira hyodysenteriae]ANN63296.1 hypothetical protein BHYOB78_05300 [Brachyspira hyodysenteriae ATCC 27164]AUJ50364.1 hypothetical protein BH718_01931 [Brachyspira hyodysenteriae]KLI13890.1 hypothetical protein SU45_11880 [Brachyspira hyodysenteriae]KLI14570.1 hypothetical protein SU44_10750 [Brachyspira hyodysenteriae]KLI19891.1 hypothetical protein SU46_05705 [Brachyspira hyodysenteriae]
MKKILITLIVILFILVSCLEDLDSVRKESLFAFYDEMKTQILNDDINWIEKNSNIENVENIKNIILDNTDSLKKLISSSNKEYSVTINYTIGDSANPSKGYYIVRNTEFSPTYYYIRLVNNSNKWKIESIDKLPLK